MQASCRNPGGLARQAALVALTVTAASLAASGAEAARKTSPALIGRSVAYQSLWRYNDAAMIAPCVIVARSAAEWDLLMQALVAKGQAIAPEPAPPLDWSQQAAVVVAMGEVPLGYRLEIVGARRDGRRTVLQVVIDQPTAGYGSSGYSHPAQAVALASKGLTDLSIESNVLVPGWPTGAPLAVGGAQDVGTMALSSGSPAAVAASPASGPRSWGALKHEYR